MVLDCGLAPVGPRGGASPAIQRFRGSANLNIHVHALLFDSVYTRATPTSRPRFHRLPPPTETEMKEKKARVEDALNATRAAVEEGTSRAAAWRCSAPRRRWTI